MIKVKNITDETYQQHSILFEKQSITVELRFLPQVERWMLSASFQGRSVTGIFLSLGVLHINNSLFPFDFIVKESSGTGIDPFKADDFTSRCTLYMLEAQDMIDIRGLPVAI